jgi:hypothetical protein
MTVRKQLAKQGVDPKQAQLGGTKGRVLFDKHQVDEVVSCFVKDYGAFEVEDLCLEEVSHRLQWLEEAGYGKTDCQTWDLTAYARMPST